MKFRALLGLVVVLMSLGAVIPAAHAQYPPTVAAGRVTRSEVKKCQCTQFSGDGFQPGSTVTVYDRQPNGTEKVLGTAKVDDKGGFRFRACFDETSPEGEHTLIGRGTGADGGPREVRSNVRVEGSVCFRKGDEIHDPSVIVEEPRGTESPAPGGGGGNDPGSEVGGNRNNRGSDGLANTGAGYVLPGLLLGFLLVVTGTAAVHAARRRRLVTG